MDEVSLDRDFRKAFGTFLGEGNIEAFYDFFEAGGFFVDEDNPFLLNKADFQDHRDFHASGIWEFMDWKPRNLDLRTFGSSGLVSCNFTYRGKPKSGGYRQRHGICTIVCHFDKVVGRWKGICMHLSPLLSHLHHNSPG